LARGSLQVGLLAVAIALMLGTTLGLLAGFYGGRMDDVLMRLVDNIRLSGLVLAIVIAGLLGPSRNNAHDCDRIVYAPAFARVVRGSVLAVRQEVHMDAARVLGASDWPGQAPRIAQCARSTHRDG
jgi:peptide/nickel transport system permease protein